MDVDKLHHIEPDEQSGLNPERRIFDGMNCWPTGTAWECDIMSHPPVRRSVYNDRMNSTILSSLPGHGQLRRLAVLRSLAVAAQLLILAAARELLGVGV